MKTLEKVQAAGYEVLDRKYNNGKHVIRITAPGMWYTKVFCAYDDGETIRVKMAALLARCARYLRNPITA